jgi:hypothetical protein
MILKYPSAWIPITLSLIVLIAFLVGVALFGPPIRQPDEGAGAHLFQIWLVLEVLMIAFFAIKWVPQRPKDALQILILQIVATLAACAPVFYFHL